METIAESSPPPGKHRQMTPANPATTTAIAAAAAAPPHPHPPPPPTTVRSLSTTELPYGIPSPRTAPFSDWNAPTHAILDRQQQQQSRETLLIGRGQPPPPPPPSVTTPAQQQSPSLATARNSDISQQQQQPGIISPQQQQRISSHSPRQHDITSNSQQPPPQQPQPPENTSLPRADSLSAGPSCSSSSTTPLNTPALAQSRYHHHQQQQQQQQQQQHHHPIYRTWTEPLPLPQGPGPIPGPQGPPQPNNPLRNPRHSTTAFPTPGPPPPAAAAAAPPPPHLIQGPPPPPPGPPGPGPGPAGPGQGPPMTPGPYPVGPAVHPAHHHAAAAAHAAHAAAAQQQHQQHQHGMQYDPNGYIFSQAMSLRQPRRTTRAQQACEQCRSRKAKCDEGRPSCSHCKENNVQCVYKDAPPHKLERSTQLILDKLQNMQEQMNTVLKNNKQQQQQQTQQTQQSSSPKSQQQRKDDNIVHDETARGEEDSRGKDGDNILELVQDKLRNLPDQIAESLTQGIVEKLFARLDQFNDTKDFSLQQPQQQPQQQQQQQRRYTRQKTFHDVDVDDSMTATMPVSSSAATPAAPPPIGPPPVPPAPAAAPAATTTTTTTAAAAAAAAARSAAEEAACESFDQYSQQYKYDIAHTNPNTTTAAAVATLADDKQPSIPHEHTTAAHKLLMWPAIQRLVGADVRQDYVMELEEARGPLRPYGRGEGDSSALVENLYFNCSSAGGGGGGGGGGGTGAGGAGAGIGTGTGGQGQGQGQGPGGGPPLLWEGGHYYIHNPSASKPFSYGYCDSFGVGSPLITDEAVPEPVQLRDLCTLNVNAQMVWRHHQSYLDNIHILHPILEENSLIRVVEDFIRNYSISSFQPTPTPQPQPQSPHAQSQPTMGSPGSVGGAAMPIGNMIRPLKRKRSSENGVIDMPPPPPQQQQQSPPWAQERTASNTIHRSIENSIVLLVLSLGAICSWKGELPGFVQDTCSNTMSTFDHRNHHPPHNFHDSPMAMDYEPVVKPDPDAAAAAAAAAATGGGGIGCGDGGSAAAGGNVRMPRNLDNIPGMAYYAFACDILSSHEGRTDLPYAQACILAGLYAGQVAYPFTSHAWLSQASRACQMLVRTSKYSSLPNESLHKHLISFAFWTCQQLESDILAELDLPHSGLSRYESKVKFPDFLRVHNISGGPESPRGQILVLYLTQIVLRNVLNGTHTHLYKADDQNNGKEIPHSKVTALLHFKKTLSINLEEWRQSLPPLLQWNDGDPPSDDINIARMRAKYYGARYIIHRPLLHHALHSFTDGHPYGGSSSMSISSEPNPITTTAAASPCSVNSVTGAPSPRLSARLISQIKAMDSAGAGVRSGEFGPGSNDDDHDQDIQTIKACCICIDSAFHSTTAFDGLRGRPIVTNIFGTAHAQFGNMLVLSAAYNSPLRPLVDGDKLLSLLNRTIRFLSQNRYISPSLRRDADILTSIKQKMFDNKQSSPRSDTPL